MKFCIIFTYMDGEELEVEVSPEDMEKFMSSLGSSEVYFNDVKGVGLWVSVDKVRYFHVEKIDENGNRVLGKDPIVQAKSEEAEGGDELVTEGGSGSVEFSPDLGTDSEEV